MAGASDTSVHRGPLPGRARYATFGAFATLVVIGLAIRLPSNLPLAIAATVVALGAGAGLLASSRRLVLASAAVATAGVAVIGNGAASNVGWFALCVLAGWCVLAAGRRNGLIYWAGSLLLFGGEWLWATHDPGWAAWTAGVTFTVVAALLVDHQLDLVAQLRTAQAGLAEQARTEERNRIARELHDVIAHSLTVSLLHVSSARLAVQYDPDDAVRALAEAERLGRDSLNEVRNAVGLLRQEGQVGDATAPPLPGAGGLPMLIDQFRSAGAEVALTIAGDTVGLPATTGLAVYRIVQEAVTNAIRHVPGAAITVNVRVEAGTVDLAVDSAGEPGQGRGLGMISMRERAESLGGTCQAGPGGSGWLVRATLPLPAGPPLEAAT